MYTFVDKQLDVLIMIFSIYRIVMLLTTFLPTSGAELPETSLSCKKITDFTEYFTCSHKVILYVFL